MKASFVIWLSLLSFAGQAQPPPNPDQDSSPSAATQIHKKKKLTRSTSARHTANKKNKALARYAPAGVTTTLPQKRGVAQTTSEFTKAEKSGESTYEMPNALASLNQKTGLHANLDFTRAFIYSSDAHVGNDTVEVLQFTPRLVWDVSERTSIYGQVPFASYSPSNTNGFDSIGRPELGAFRTIYTDEDWSFGAGLSLKLPFFDFRGSNSEFVEPMRVWEVAPGVALNYTMPDEETHVFGTLKVAYDTAANFSHNVTVENTGGIQNVDGIARPLASVGVIGLSHDTFKFTLGLALHTYNWLSTGKITSDGSTVREIPGLALSHGELFGAYRFTTDTSINIALTKGFKTDADPSTFALYDLPVEMANTSLSLGFAHIF